MTTSIEPTTAPARQLIAPDGHPLSFIEVQFPVNRLSKESYKERKGAQGQALTGLGKWWGRKPLVLVRAIILGLLLPATADSARDRETFLALMTMDDDGLWARVRGAIPAGAVYDKLTPRERTDYFITDLKGKTVWKAGLSATHKKAAQRRAFSRMGLDDKLNYCVRPEEIAGPSLDGWGRINAHLGTSALNLPGLVEELGTRRFGHLPRVGDVFSGGGSIPFEAARLGCEAYGSDLNPVAALLTWGALNIVGGGKGVTDRVAAAQRRVFDKVQKQVDEWGIERDPDTGRGADAYLYCNEVVDPATGWRVPLAPSWVIAKRAKQVIARLVPDGESKSFTFEIHEGATAAELEQAAREGTAADGVRCPVDAAGNWLLPENRQTTGTDTLRGRAGLRPWENADLVPRPDDVYGERLYCVRWVDPATGERHYRAPTAADAEREERVLRLLRERFAAWQEAGYVPSRRIEPGQKTDEPIRTRGWTHWHHLFNPRQLLLHGLFAHYAAEESGDEARAMLLLIARLANADARLCQWHSGNDQHTAVFYNQALNTFVNYGGRGMAQLRFAFCGDIQPDPVSGNVSASVVDARSVEYEADWWITDPGYGDAVAYDELSEFFLAWYERRLPELFPGWYTDSKRALAVKGEGANFRVTLAACYRRTASLMPNDGYQVVMFTHQDPEVWADLALVLWSAGLQVMSAWTIATETGSAGIRQGNYVQGTVNLVLRKRRGDREADMSEVFPDVQAEVTAQLAAMTQLDPKDDPNFGDADYQLAAYAAALRVLTGYASVEGIDVERELRRERKRGEKSQIAELIAQAVRIANDALLPNGVERSVWANLSPEARFYLKGIEMEAGREHKQGAYQEYARGYGANDYADLLASSKANATRLKTPTEFAGRDVRYGSAGFGGTLLRQVLFAVYKTATHPERDPRPARDHLRRELPDFWGDRDTILALLDYLATKPDVASGTAPHWAADVAAARLLAASVQAASA